MDPKKIANNMLEFLYDPTVIPVKTRLYFRPEENLQNQAYEQAKADAKAAFGNQAKNSDFYPSRNKSIEREASMDRKTLIASLDVLSQNFSEDDPIGKDLRTMAYAVANMEEEEFGTRMAKFKMVECPDCGGKMPKGGKCFKCMHAKKAAEACTVCGKEPCACEEKKAEVKDFWTKEASEAVQQAIIADFIDAKEEMWADDEDTPPAAPEEKKDAPPAAPEEKEEKKEEKKEEIPAPAPEEPKEAAKACPPEEEKKEKAVVEEPKDAVDTSILAYDGIEVGASMEDVAELTVEEKSQLDKLFN